MSALKSWFQITNEAGAERAQIQIFAEIGFFGVTPADFCSALASIPAERDIDLLIHSPGGSVLDGMVIYNAIARRRDKITARIEGTAASMATVIACAASKITMPENGWFMIHNVKGGGGGESDDLRRAAEIMDKLTEQVVAIYAKKTGKSPEEIQKAMDAETWFTAAAAKEFGFCDEITDAIDAKAKTEFFARFKNGPIPPEPGAPNPQEEKPSTQTTMKKLLDALVAEKLISSADLTEDAAAAEFATNFAAIKAELQAAEAAEATAQETAAQTAITAAIDDGRITLPTDEAKAKEAKAVWVNTFKANPDATKAMLETMAPKAAAPAEEPKPGREPLKVKGPDASAQAGNSDALWKQYQAIKDAKARTVFFRNHIRPLISR